MNEQSCLNIQSLDENEKFDFYFSKLQILQNRIIRFIDQLKIPLPFISPPNFQERIIQAENQYKIDKQWAQKYPDIIIYGIQGQINISIMGLALKFRQQFGGDSLFWLETISKFGQDQKYDQNFRMWQVNDCYKEHLHLQISEYDKRRKFRKLAKTDIEVTKKLISSINQLKSTKQNTSSSKKIFKQDILQKVQLNYKKHEQSRRKVAQFLKGHNNRKNQLKNGNQLQFFESKNIRPKLKIPQEKKQSQNSRSKKISKEVTNVVKQKTITDYSINLAQKKGILLLRKIQGQQGKNIASKQSKQLKIKQLDSHFNNLQINSPIFSMQDLRLNAIQNKSKLLSKSKPFYTTTIISYSALWYKQFMITQQDSLNFNLTQPFQKKQFVNYENTQIEQFQQLLGENIDNSEGQQYDSEDIQTHQSSQDEQIQRWIDDGVGFDVEDQDEEIHKKAISLEFNFEGTPWILNHKEKQPLDFCITKRCKIKQYRNQTQNFLNNFRIIPYQDMPMRLQQLKQDQLDELRKERLRQIADGRTYNQILTIIQSDRELREQITRKFLNKFLSQNTTSKLIKKNGKRIKYFFLIEKNEEKQQNQFMEQKNGNSRRSSKSNTNKSGNMKIQQFFTNKNKPNRMISQQQIDQDEDQQSQSSQEEQQQWTTWSRKNFQQKSQTRTITNKKQGQQNNKIRKSQNNQNQSEQKDQQCDSNTTKTIGQRSISLRQRKNKPNYSILSLLGRNKKNQSQMVNTGSQQLNNKEQSEQTDIQI